MGTSPPLGGLRRPIVRALARVGLPLAMLLTFSGSALAFHWQTDGWYDRHYNYPVRPHGQAQIEATFGKPCSKDANYNRFTWLAEGEIWKVNFHRKLGGAAVSGWYAGNGGTSSNLFYDVRGHIANDHLTMRGGIGAYNCREHERPGALQRPRLGRRDRHLLEPPAQRRVRGQRHPARGLPLLPAPQLVLAGVRQDAFPVRDGVLT